MTITILSLKNTHPSWHECLSQALSQMDQHYLEMLRNNQDWLPGADKIFNAFSIPLENTNYVLLGESPYPRQVSANGYAFWDADVKELWSPTGLSKKVNRATSLRNIIKMLLVADHLLDPQQVNQEAIAKLDKCHVVQTNQQLFTHMLQRGFLLLNATPVLQSSARQKDARLWQPFLAHVLTYLTQKRPQIKFLLLGRIAKDLGPLIEPLAAEKIYAEHPYNYTFINNQTVLNFFRPLQLLRI